MECTDAEPADKLDSKLLKVLDYFSNSITLHVHLPEGVYTTEERVCKFAYILLYQFHVLQRSGLSSHSNSHAILVKECSALSV